MHSSVFAARHPGRNASTPGECNLHSLQLSLDHGSIFRREHYGLHASGGHVAGIFQVCFFFDRGLPRLSLLDSRGMPEPDLR